MLCPQGHSPYLDRVSRTHLSASPGRWSYWINSREYSKNPESSPWTGLLSCKGGLSITSSAGPTVGNSQSPPLTFPTDQVSWVLR